MGGLQASPHPCSHFSAFLSITEASLADWLLRIKSLGNPVVRFDTSLASLLALPRWHGCGVAVQRSFVLELGSQAQAQALEGTPTMVSQPPHPEAGPGFDLGRVLGKEGSWP